MLCTNVGSYNLTTQPQYPVNHHDLSQYTTVLPSCGAAADVLDTKQRVVDLDALEVENARLGIELDECKRQKRAAEDRVRTFQTIFRTTLSSVESARLLAPIPHAAASGATAAAPVDPPRIQEHQAPIPADPAVVPGGVQGGVGEVPSADKGKGREAVSQAESQNPGSATSPLSPVEDAVDWNAMLLDADQASENADGPSAQLASSPASDGQTFAPKFRSTAAANQSSSLADWGTPKALSSPREGYVCDFELCGASAHTKGYCAIFFGFATSSNLPGPYNFFNAIYARKMDLKQAVDHAKAVPLRGRDDKILKWNGELVGNFEFGRFDYVHGSRAGVPADWVFKDTETAAALGDFRAATFKTHKRGTSGDSTASSSGTSKRGRRR